MEDLEKLAEGIYPVNYKCKSGVVHHDSTALEKRKAYKKGYQKAQEWISVDTPPKEMGKYICFYLNGNINLSHWNEDIWFDYDGYEQSPTHWQPLPTTKLIGTKKDK